MTTTSTTTRGGLAVGHLGSNPAYAAFTALDTGRTVAAYSGANDDIQTLVDEALCP